MTSRSLTKPRFDIFELFFAVFGYTAGGLAIGSQGVGTGCATLRNSWRRSFMRKTWDALAQSKSKENSKYVAWLENMSG